MFMDKHKCFLCIYKKHPIILRSINREPSRRSVYLSKFLRRRPTHEELKAQGIIKVKRKYIVFLIEETLVTGQLSVWMQDWTSKNHFWEDLAGSNIRLEVHWKDWEQPWKLGDWRNLQSSWWCCKDAETKNWYWPGMVYIA